MVTLESLKKLHEQKGKHAASYGVIRSRARELAKKKGAPVPAWASQRHPLFSARAPVITDGSFAPIDLSAIEQLRAWRRGGPCRAFTVSAVRGVELIEYEPLTGERSATFATPKDALAAIASGAIAWRPPEVFA